MLLSKEIFHVKANFSLFYFSKSLWLENARHSFFYSLYLFFKRAFWCSTPIFVIIVRSEVLTLFHIQLRLLYVYHYFQKSKIKMFLIISAPAIRQLCILWGAVISCVIDCYHIGVNGILQHFKPFTIRTIRTVSKSNPCGLLTHQLLFESLKQNFDGRKNSQEMYFERPLTSFDFNMVPQYLIT